MRLPNRPFGGKFISRLTALLLLAAMSTANAMTIAELEARAEKDAATSAGSAYQVQATRAFWGDAAFMKLCVPVGTPSVEPFSIYLEVKADGQMGQLEFKPTTPVAQCIASKVIGRTFPKPPFPYVLRIDLRFR